MPLYDYRCQKCGHEFEARHGFDAPRPGCPNCQAADPERIITRAPMTAQGMVASVGDNPTKDELRAKWAEETPKLRKKLVDKLGEDTVNRNAPTLNHKFD